MLMILVTFARSCILVIPHWTFFRFMSNSPRLSSVPCDFWRSMIARPLVREQRTRKEHAKEFVGDPQTAVSHLGDVVLLVQYIIIRFRVRISGCLSSFIDKEEQLNPSSTSMLDQTISASYLFSSANVQDPGTLSTEEAIAFTAWFKALFDSNSEGIEDTILRRVH